MFDAFMSTKLDIFVGDTARRAGLAGHCHETVVSTDYRVAHFKVPRNKVLRNGSLTRTSHLRSVSLDISGGRGEQCPDNWSGKGVYTFIGGF